MYYSNIDIEIIDFMDLINFTLSDKFIKKWRHKYSESFIRHFQLKILDSISKGKPLKLTTLYIFLTKKCRYSSTQVLTFFDDIDIVAFAPLIADNLKIEKRDKF